MAGAHTPLTGDHYHRPSFKLRSAGVTAIGTGEFLVQSFGVDENEITIYPSTTDISESDDFTGASLGGKYISANFQRLAFFDSLGNELFIGQTVGRTEFDETREDAFLGQISR